MKRIIGILIVFGILSCQQNKPRIESIESKDLTSEQIDSILSKFEFQYESPIILDSTNQILIPISTELIESKKGYRSYSRYDYDDYSSDGYARYWNVLFYNNKTGDSRLLTENKIRITTIDTKSNKINGTNKILEDKILYQIGDTDYNKDNKLNYKDPEFLFVSEINGTKLKRISPSNEDLQYYEVIPNSEQILIRTLRDVNRDSIFDEDDELILYKIEFSKNEWKINEVIDSTLRKSIENLYFEQWLKKK